MTTQSPSFSASAFPVSGSPTSKQIAAQIPNQMTIYECIAEAENEERALTVDAPDADRSETTIVPENWRHDDATFERVMDRSE